MSGIKLLQDQPAEQAREHAYGEEEAGTLLKTALDGQRPAKAEGVIQASSALIPTPLVLRL
jgi:hypothetical protein